MCEILCTMKMNGRIDDYEVDEFMKAVKESFKGNPHGWGIFNDTGSVLKKLALEETDVPLAKGAIAGSKFMIAHTRWATTGEKSPENSHPFQNDRFLWVHNGVLDLEDCKKTGYEFKVDSEVIGWVVLEKVSQGESVVEGIKDFASKVSGGYSVMLYDKLEKKLYYFKNGQQFKFMLLKRGRVTYVMGATDLSKLRDNMFTTYEYGFAIKDFEEVAVREPQDGSIYEVGNLGIKYLGTFTAKAKTFTYTRSEGYQSHFPTQRTGGTSNEPKQVTVTKTKEERDEELDNLKLALEYLCGDIQVDVRVNKKGYIIIESTDLDAVEEELKAESFKYDRRPNPKMIRVTKVQLREMLRVFCLKADVKEMLEENYSPEEVEQILKYGNIEEEFESLEKEQVRQYLLDKDLMYG